MASRGSAVKLQSRKERRAVSHSLTALAISTKNKHLLAIYSIPARGFTAAVSVFKGTPLAKPFDCKIWVERAGGCLRGSVSALVEFGDIVMMSRASGSQCSCLSLSLFSCLCQNKTPCLLVGKQGGESGSSLYLLTPVGFV